MFIVHSVVRRFRRKPQLIQGKHARLPSHIYIAVFISNPFDALQKDKPEKKRELVDDSVVASLKLKIDELNQELSVSKTEVDAAHDELARLQDRFDSLQKEASQRNQDFKKKLAAALAENEKQIRAEMSTQEAAKLEEVAARHRDELARREQAQKTMIEILEDKLVEVCTLG